MIVKSIASLFRNKLLLLTTIIPTVLAIVYFGLIASDVYISESRFVVRSPERQGPRRLWALSSRGLVFPERRMMPTLFRTTLSRVMR